MPEIDLDDDSELYFFANYSQIDMDESFNYRLPVTFTGRKRCGSTTTRNPVFDDFFLTPCPTTIATCPAGGFVFDTNTFNYADGSLSVRLYAALLRQDAGDLRRAGVQGHQQQGHDLRRVGHAGPELPGHVPAQFAQCVIGPGYPHRVSTSASFSNRKPT